MTTPELSRHDAISIPLVVSEIGIPALGLSILAGLGQDAPADSPLAKAIDAQAAAFRAAEPRLDQQFESIGKMLAQYGAAAAARPTGAREYMSWNDLAIATLAKLTGPDRPEGALAALARTYGDFVQALALAIVVAQLRRAAPDAPRVVAQEQSLARRLVECVDRLRKVAALSSLPEEARASAQRIVATAGLALKLDGSDAQTREAGLKMIFEKLGKEIAALRAAANG